MIHPVTGERIFSMRFSLAIVSLGLISAGHSVPWAVNSAECSHASSLRRAFLHGMKPNLTPRKALEGVADTDVLNNVLNLEMAPPSNVITASTVITAKSLREDLGEFTFRLSDSFTLGTVTLDGRPITVTRLDPTTCRAVFDAPYDTGQQFVLNVPYSGPANSSFFGSIVFGTRTSGAPYCFTLSEPWYAYTWWANKDDNTDKATFDINVTVPNTLTAVSNGVLLGTDALSGNRSRFRWRSNYAMSPYLAAIGVTNYNTWSRTYPHSGGTMPVQFWIWPESDNATNRAAWELCLPMMEVFKPIYGEYPFVDEKYGMYQFTFGGGMEHQTNSGMGGFWEGVNAHELAHQWWGDMVTCAKWEDIWLNEGFASYSEALWSERKVGGSFAAYKQTMADKRPTQTSGTVYCYDISDPNRIFSSNYSYRKSAWALHMLRRIVGDTTFFNILADYREAHEYKTATTEDFIASCERVYGKDLNWFFDKAVYGGGVPNYQWAWQNTTSNGKNYLLLYVRQYQSATFGTFTMPIDIRPTVGGVKQDRKVWNDALVENYVIPLTGSASAVTFDEDVWILKSNTATTTFVSGGPTIVEASPAPGQVAATPVTQVKITFHNNVVAAASDFKVRAENTSRTGLAFNYSYSSGTNTATLTFSRALPAGGYVVSVKDSIRAVNNNAQLDGEISGRTLPSGNGQAAGSGEYRFSVRGR